MGTIYRFRRFFAFCSDISTKIFLIKNVAIENGFFLQNINKLIHEAKRENQTENTNPRELSVCNFDCVSKLKYALK